MGSARRAKGEGSLYKTRDGRFAVSVVIGYRLTERNHTPSALSGKPRRRPVRKRVLCRTKKEAAAELRRLLAIYNPRFAHDLTVADHLNQWLMEGRERWRIASYELYESLIRLHVLPALGASKVTILETNDVRFWQRAMAKRGVGLNTRKRAHQLMNSAIQTLVDEGRLARNVFRAVRPPQPPKPDVYVPSPRELRNLIEACTDVQTRTIVLLAATTLLRIGEIFALRPQDVDLARNRLSITASLLRNDAGETVRGLPKTASSRRIVTMPKVAAKALKQFLAYRKAVAPDSPWLFCLPCGEPIERHNFRNRAWLPLLKSAGLPKFMHFHSLRHAGNSLLLDAGVSILVVAARCGHADTRMTLDRYGHIVRAGADAEAAAITDRIFSKLLRNGN